MESMGQTVALHLGLNCKGKKRSSDKIIHFFFKLQPDTPRYVQWTIPNCILSNQRKNPLVYKVLIGADAAPMKGTIIYAYFLIL